MAIGNEPLVHFDKKSVSDEHQETDDQKKPKQRKLVKKGFPDSDKFNKKH